MVVSKNLKGTAELFQRHRKQGVKGYEHPGNFFNPQKPNTEELISSTKVGDNIHYKVLQIHTTNSRTPRHLGATALLRKLKLLTNTLLQRIPSPGFLH